LTQGLDDALVVSVLEDAIARAKAHPATEGHAAA
jgi:hypothetical protein